MKNKQSVSVQFLQFISLVIPNLPRNFRPDRLDHYVGSGKSELKERLLAAFEDDLIHEESDLLLKQWETLYREEFGETHDFSGVVVPQRDGFAQSIIVAKGMMMNRVYDACQQRFPCWRYTDDLDKNVLTNNRVPTDHYVICVRDRVEADEELRNLSADDLAERGIKGITLLERMLLEFKYFRETGKHLDIQNITLCSGSRGRGGRVPCACWGGGKFSICWNGRGCRGSVLRSREAVSL